MTTTTTSTRAEKTPAVDVNVVEVNVVEVNVADVIDVSDVIDVLDLVALALRRCAPILRKHDVILRVEVAEGAAAILVDGHTVERTLSALLAQACTSSPPFAQLTLRSRRVHDAIELALDANGSCSVVCCAVMTSTTASTPPTMASAGASAGETTAT